MCYTIEVDVKLDVELACLGISVLYPISLQLIYSFKEGSPFMVMSLHPDQIPRKDNERLEKIGVVIPSML